MTRRPGPARRSPPAPPPPGTAPPSPPRGTGCTRRPTHRHFALAAPRRELPVIDGTLIRLQVDHLPGDRDPEAGVAVVRCSRTGATAGDVDRYWQAFLRRFDLRAHLPAVQAGPRVDRTQDPQPRRCGPVDLADHRRPHPAPPGPRPGRRPAPPVGAARPARTAHPGPGPPRIPEPPREDRLPGRCTETRQARPRTPPRIEEPPSRTLLRRRQDHQTRTQPQSPARPDRLNGKLRAGCQGLAGGAGGRGRRSRWSRCWKRNSWRLTQSG